MGKKQRKLGEILTGIVLAVLTIAILFLYLLCLTSSSFTDPHLPPIYLAQIQQSNTSIFVGFYGICTSQSSSPQSRICTPTISRSTDSLIAILFPNTTNTTNLTNTTTIPSSPSSVPSPSPLPATPSLLLPPALTLQRTILPTPLPLATLFHLLPLLILHPVSLLLSRLHHSRSPHPPWRLRARRLLRTLTFALYGLSAVLALGAALLAVEGVSAFVFGKGAFADGGGGDKVSVSQGKLLIVLLWVVAVLESVFVGLVVWVWRRWDGDTRNKEEEEEKKKKRADWGVSWWRGEEDFGRSEGGARVFVF